MTHATTPTVICVLLDRLRREQTAILRKTEAHATVRMGVGSVASQQFHTSIMRACRAIRIERGDL